MSTRIGREAANAHAFASCHRRKGKNVLQPCLGAPRPCRLMDSIGRRLGDLLDHWPFSWAGSNENIITSIRNANPGEVEFYLGS